MTARPKSQEPKQPILHKDKLGRVIEVGRFVAYPQHNMLDFGRVVKINPKMIGLEGLPTARGWRGKCNKYPQDLLLLEDRDMTWYLLKNSSQT